MTLADLDPAAILGWLATFLVHSTLWIVGAWLVARRVDSASLRERLWKGALVGGLLTTVLVTSLATTRLSWHLESERASMSASIDETAGGGRPIVLEVPATAPSPLAGAAERGEVDAGATPTEPEPLVTQPSRPRVGTILLAIWLAGAAVGLAHLAWAHRRLARALRSRRRVVRGPLVDALAELTAVAGGPRRVRISTSRALPSPIALARGEIVVPEQALTRLGSSELETLLAHELAHVLRRDPWWLLALQLLRRVLWVQPLLGVVTERLVNAAEMRCDELAARWTRGEVALARCLAEVATWIEDRPTAPLLAGMAERPSALVERVERLLKPRRVSRTQGVLVGVWLAGMLGVLACQGPEVRPESEADGGQPHTPEDPDSRSVNLGRVSVIRADPGEPSPEGEITYGVTVSSGQEGEPAKGATGSTPEEAVEKLKALGYVERAEVGEEPLGYSREAVREQVKEMMELHLRNQSELRKIEASIAEKRTEQAGLKPTHPQYQKLEREIQMLETQRDQILLGMRAKAGEQGRVDTTGGSKLHVTTIQQGNTSMSSAAPHALRLHADGSIDCVTTQLVPPGGTDDTALVEHLEEIALGMERAPLDPANPDGFRVPDGALRILIDADAPHSLLQRTLQACSLIQVQIWKFSLVQVVDGKPGEGMPFALPRDLAEIPEAVEEDAPAPGRNTIEITMSVAAAGDTSKEGSPGRILNYTLETTGPLSIDEEGLPSSTTTMSKPRNLEILGKVLRSTYKWNPSATVVIDATPGCLYADVVALLDVVIEAGFTDITFVGPRAGR